MAYIILTVVVIILLVGWIALLYSKLGYAKEKNARIETKLVEKLQRIKDLEQSEYNKQIRVGNLTHEIQACIMWIKLFINAPIKVYTQSNFYSNFNYHNGRYYAKINQAKTNNKAEAIPVIELKNTKYKILDLYRLKYGLEKLEDRKALDSKSYTTFEELDVLIENSCVSKEYIVEGLGNKVLKSYRG